MKINHYSSSIKKIHWQDNAALLIKYQNKIYRNQLNVRQIRNFQRWINHSFITKLLVIAYILEINYIKSRLIEEKLVRKKFLYFNYIEELKINFNFKRLIKNSYRSYLQVQIQNALWVLGYLPIHERLSNHSYLQNRLTRQNHQFNNRIYEYLFKDSVDLVQLIQFHLAFFLSSRLKYWILNYMLVEAKYLVYWFYNRKLEKRTNLFDQIHLIRECNISFFFFIKAFYNCCFFFFLNYNKFKQTNNYCIQFNSFFFVNSKVEYNLFFDNENIYSYNLNEGINLLGWFIKKKNQ